MNKETIKNNFSKYAKSYDKYSSIQDMCAATLISRITRCDFKKILDIGCGTGNFTGLLRRRFPTADIKALDISEGMIDIAKKKLKDKGIEFILGDAETVELGEEFDLIGSNASFQWFGKLERTIPKYSRLLTQGGVMIFTVFGRKTLCELGASLKEVFGEDVSVASRDFPGEKMIKDTMRRCFNKAVIEEETRMEKPHSLKALLTQIKYTGTRGNGIDKKLWTQKTMENLERIYKKRFGGIVATYQVFFCKGVR